MSVEQFVEAFNMREPPSPKGALPVVTFTDAVTFHLNGDEIHAFHVPPAHTDGDAIVHFRTANVVHMGDLFFNGMYPFIDVSTGGSIDGMISAAERVLGMIGAETKVIPGHGPVAGRSELTAYRDMLVGVRESRDATRYRWMEPRARRRREADGKVRRDLGEGVPPARQVRGNRLQGSLEAETSILELPNRAKELESHDTARGFLTTRSGPGH